MGLCKTSYFSIFTFNNARELKFCTRSSAGVYTTWWGLKVPMEKLAKWWRHTSTSTSTSVLVKPMKIKSKEMSAPGVFPLVLLWGENRWLAYKSVDRFFTLRYVTLRYEHFYFRWDYHKTSVSEIIMSFITCLILGELKIDKPLSCLRKCELCRHTLEQL